MINKVTWDNFIIGKIMSKTALFFIAFVAQGIIGLVSAEGVYDPTSSTITLPSSLVIPANTEIGTIVYTSDAISTSMKDGKSSTSAFASEYATSPTLSSYGNNVYETGITGLGFRLRGVFQTPAQSGIEQYYSVSTAQPSYYWLGSQTTSYEQYTYLELVVIGNSVESGSLDLSGVTARLRFNYDSTNSSSESTWLIYLSGTTEVTSASCEVNTYDTSVDLGTMYTQNLKAAGSTSNTTDFTINLTCSSSLVPNITFSGTVDSNNNNIFANDSGTATGVGIQLLYDNIAITPDTAVSLGTVTSTSATDYDFKARLYQTTNTVTAGSVDTTVNFTLEYE
ncbi:fimbrial protein [Lonsdalea quercina]|uniref:Pilin (Type 1 fimbria component protein) n=1 Tax=Lonsdalea quercina TaxID=71657 RepID=A0A1H4DDK2_9GAMM|nr:fimbrial protein [Lonsdalea quercina]SEA70804.1 Pilin (type 1 fimbria component protein) [Lonsdalea quercina]